MPRLYAHAVLAVLPGLAFAQLGLEPCQVFFKLLYFRFQLLQLYPPDALLFLA